MVLLPATGRAPGMVSRVLYIIIQSIGVRHTGKIAVLR